MKKLCLCFLGILITQSLAFGADCTYSRLPVCKGLREVKVGETVVPRVNAAENCKIPDNEWGWYYDDPVSPQVIQICPSLCENIMKDDSGRVNIVLGCGSTGK